MREAGLIYFKKGRTDLLTKEGRSGRQKPGPARKTMTAMTELPQSISHQQIMSSEDRYIVNIARLRLAMAKQRRAVAFGSTEKANHMIEKAEQVLSTAKFLTSIANQNAKMNQALLDRANREVIEAEAILKGSIDKYGREPTVLDAEEQCDECQSLSDRVSKYLSPEYQAEKQAEDMKSQIRLASNLI